MSCDYCTQTKGALRMAQSQAASPTQMRLQWAHSALLLPRCPRGHFVSPRTMTCRPCNNLVLGPPQGWPPQGYYTRMRQAVTDLRAGVGDHLVAEHKRTKPRTITLYVDSGSGQLVRAVPDAEMAAPSVVAAPAAAQPAAAAPAPAVVEEAAPAPIAPQTGWAYVANDVQSGEAPVDLTAVPPGMPEAQWAKLKDDERRTAVAGMIARGEAVLSESPDADGRHAVEAGPAAQHCPTCGKWMSPTQGCRYCAAQTGAPADAGEQLAGDALDVTDALVADEATLAAPEPAQEGPNPFASAGDRMAKWYAARRERRAVPAVPAPGMPMPAMAQALAGMDGGGGQGTVLTELTVADLTADESKFNRQGESRWSRAQELIDRVRATGTPGVYEYGGGRGKAPYEIDLNAIGPGGQRGTCTCEDCQNAGANGTRCKHILAAHQRAARDGVVLGAAPVPAPAPPLAQAQAAGLSREDAIRQQIEAVTGVTHADLDALESAGCPPRLPFAEAPFIDDTYELTPQAAEVLQGMGGLMRFQLAQRRAGREGACTVGIYGPPGTGKNTTARQLAATLGLPFEETDVNKDTDVAGLFGGIGIRSRDGATETYAASSRIGMALESGAVVCINEVNTLPAETQTMLHQIAQEGRWTVPGPEGAQEVHYVHPASTLVLTWNESEGMPQPALLSRLVTFEMQHPTEDQEKGMLTQWATGSGLPVDQGDVDRTVQLVRGLRTLHEQGNLSVPPSFRDMKHFYMMLKTTGSLTLAVRQLRKNLEQTYERTSQWASVQPLIQRWFPQFQGLPW